MLKKALEGLSVLLILLGIVAAILGGLTIKKELDEEERLRIEAEAAAEAEAKAAEEAALREAEKAAQEAAEKAKAEEEAEEESVTPAKENPAVGQLAYDLLDDETKLVYEDILNACEQQEEKVELRTLKEDLIAIAYQAVTCDYGGLFWVSGYTYTIRTIGDEVTGLDFAPNYVFTKEERTAYQSSVDTAVANYLANIDQNASDYEKVKYIYEMLSLNVDYQLESEQNQNILSVFLYGESVCNGYASAAQYLLSLLDVPCMIVYGTSQGENHAWNLVYEDGEPYFLDCTWGSTTSKTIGSCSYDYLNMSSRDISKTHQLDMLLTLPECTVETTSYFAREGRYFTEFDEAKIGALLAADYSSGVATTALKFSTDEIYQQVRDTFITNMKTADYCSGLERIGYVENEKMRVLTFMW
jgi:Tfp pilus assembly protein PilX